MPCLPVRLIFGKAGVCFSRRACDNDTVGDLAVKALARSHREAAHSGDRREQRNLIFGRGTASRACDNDTVGDLAVKSLARSGDRREQNHPCLDPYGFTKIFYTSFSMTGYN